MVVVHDAGEIDGRVFLAMGFVEGQTLASWLAAAPRTSSRSRDVFASAGRGLAAAHAAGLVHRDFKPQNVMVAGDGSVQVTDFGLAVDLSSEQDRARAGDLRLTGVPLPDTLALTRTGALVGTPLYMAPEQLLGRRTDAHTDQFSFCVCLYAALCGEHPFPAGSFAELRDAVTSGRIREGAPWKDPRALAGGAPARARGRSRAALPFHGGAARGPWSTSRAGAGGWRWRRSRSGGSRWRRRSLRRAFATGPWRLFPSATPVAARLSGAWESSDAIGRRASVHRAFFATSPAPADGAWGRLGRVLDDYASGWVAEYRDACERTHFRGDQSSEVLDLRMACLDSRLESLRSLTEVLTRTDEGVVAQSVQAAYALPPLDRCRDVALLRAAAPPPEDRALRGRVETLRSELARVVALRDTGQWPEARERGSRLIEEARATGYDPLLAQALAAICQFEGNAGDTTNAERTCEQAVFTAVAAHEDELAAQTAIILADTSGYALHRFEEAERWLGWAQAILKRLGGTHDRLAGWLSHARGDVFDARGDPAAARVELERALSLKRKVLPPDHPNLADTLTSLANELNELGDGKQALLHNGEALRIFTKSYGPDNVMVAMTLSNRSEILEGLGRHADALATETRALELFRDKLPPDHFWLAYPLTAMGRTLTSSGRAGEAISHLERALAIRLKSDPRPEPVAEARFALAAALWDGSRDRPRSRWLAEEALAIYRERPGLARRKGEVEAWLASH